MALSKVAIGIIVAVSILIVGGIAVGVALYIISQGKGDASETDSTEPIDRTTQLVGFYARHPVRTLEHQASITKVDNNTLRWANEAGESWTAEWSEDNNLFEPVLPILVDGSVTGVRLFDDVFTGPTTERAFGGGIPPPDVEKLAGVYQDVNNSNHLVQILPGERPSTILWRPVGGQGNDGTFGNGLPSRDSTGVWGKHVHTAHCENNHKCWWGFSVSAGLNTIKERVGVEYDQEDNIIALRWGNNRIYQPLTCDTLVGSFVTDMHTYEMSIPIRIDEKNWKKLGWTGWLFWAAETWSDDAGNNNTALKLLAMKDLAKPRMECRIKNYLDFSPQARLYLEANASVIVPVEWQSAETLEEQPYKVTNIEMSCE